MVAWYEISVFARMTPVWFIESGDGVKGDYTPEYRAHNERNTYTRPISVQ